MLTYISERVGSHFLCVIEWGEGWRSVKGGLSPSRPLSNATTAVTVCCSAWWEVERCVFVCVKKKWEQNKKGDKSNGSKIKSCQFVRSAAMFFSSQAKSHREPIDWPVKYLACVCVCVRVRVRACVLQGDSWQKCNWQRMKRNITLSKKWRSPCWGQANGFSTVNLQRDRWEREGWRGGVDSHRHTHCLYIFSFKRS